jgi:hypothetical protein
VVYHNSHFDVQRYNHSRYFPGSGSITQLFCSASDHTSRRPGTRSEFGYPTLCFSDIVVQRHGCRWHVCRNPASLAANPLRPPLPELRTTIEHVVRGAGALVVRAL